jgi:hypothetical protein
MTILNNASIAASSSFNARAAFWLASLRRHFNGWVATAIKCHERHASREALRFHEALASESRMNHIGQRE